MNFLGVLYIGIGGYGIGNQNKLYLKISKKVNHNHPLNKKLKTKSSPFLVKTKT
jgi:hypothetical protein